MNGEDGPLHITTGQDVVVTAGMEPGEYVGYPVDWWVVAQALGGWYYLNASMQWTPMTDFGQIHPVYQGGLFPLAPRTILEMSTLPVGAYTFYFGVDQMNGRLDLDGYIWYDSVSFEVQ